MKYFLVLFAVAVCAGSALGAELKNAQYRDNDAEVDVEDEPLFVCIVKTAITGLEVLIGEEKMGELTCSISLLLKKLQTNVAIKNLISNVPIAGTPIAKVIESFGFMLNDNIPVIGEIINTILNGPGKPIASVQASGGDNKKNIKARSVSAAALNKQAAPQLAAA